MWYIDSLVLEKEGTLRQEGPYLAKELVKREVSEREVRGSFGSEREVVKLVHERPIAFGLVILLFKNSCKVSRSWRCRILQMMYSTSDPIWMSSEPLDEVCKEIVKIVLAGRVS